MTQHIRPSAKETDIIYQRLIKAEEGDVISYEEMLTMVGRHEVDEIRGYLATAQKRAETNHNMVFAPVTGIGMKCCDDEGKIAVAKARLEQARRQSRRSGKVAISIRDYEALSDDAKETHQRIVAGTQIVALFTSRSSLDQVVNKTKPTLLGPSKGDFKKLFSN